MKYLRNIFENKDNTKEYIKLIKEEIDNINDIIYDLKDMNIRVEVSYAIGLSSEFDHESYFKLSEADLGESVHLCGYIIEVGLSSDSIISNQLDTNRLDEYIELIKTISESMKIINSHIESNSYFVMSDYGEHTLYFVKKNPTEEDYYYIFRNMLNEYIDSAENFSGFELYKTGSDYYLEFNLLEDEPVALKQIKQLKDFCSDCFEPISYDSFHKINNLNFKIKNPKIKSIKF